MVAQSPHEPRKPQMFGPFELERTLGEGEFGKVKLAYSRTNGKQVAIKLVKKLSVADPARYAKMQREIAILQKLRHRYIVTLHQVITTDTYIGLVMEYAAGGELFEHILAKRYLRETEAGRIFSQLIAAVSYLHSRQIVHRDLKLENILLDASRNVVITDFGFSNKVDNSTAFLQTACGSPCYAAPELVTQDTGYVGQAADIWSLGVILFAMLAGYLPFDDDPSNPEGDNIQQLYRYIVETTLVFPGNISLAAKELISSILVPDPALRATMPQIHASKWLLPFCFIYAMEAKEMADMNARQIKMIPETPKEEEPKHEPVLVALPSVSSLVSSAQSQEYMQPHETIAVPALINEHNNRGKSMDVRRQDPGTLCYPAAQKYHRFSTAIAPHPKKGDALQALKYHSGPVDKRALTTRDPHDLMLHITQVLSSHGYVVTSTTDAFKLKVVAHAPGKTQTKKKPGLGALISGFPGTLFKRIKHIAQFGPQYNFGYDPAFKPPPSPSTATDEHIKCTIAIHRIRNLAGLAIVDVKRQAGDIWLFKETYHKIIGMLELETNPNFSVGVGHVIVDVEPVKGTAAA